VLGCGGIERAFEVCLLLTGCSGCSCSVGLWGRSSPTFFQKTQPFFSTKRLYLTSDHRAHTHSSKNTVKVTSAPSRHHVMSTTRTCVVHRSPPTAHRFLNPRPWLAAPASPVQRNCIFRNNKQSLGISRCRLSAKLLWTLLLDAW
jgi:hypothetical protein